MWVAGGVVGYVVGLLLTGLAGSWTSVALSWLLAQLGMYAAMAGLTATIADDVPPDQRGTISAAIYGPQALGIVLGLGLVTALGGSTGSGYPLLAIVLVLAALPWVLRTREAQPTSPTGRPRSLGSALRSTWVAPGRSPDYAWAFAGRLLVNLGNALGTTYLLFLLTHELRVADPEGSLLILTLVYLVATVAATWGGGVLSDRTGRRRVFVAGAAVLQALACAVLVVAPSWPSALPRRAAAGRGLRRLHVGGPGPGHPGAARPDRRGQRTRGHERRRRRPAGSRAPARRPGHRRARRLRRPVRRRRPVHRARCGIRRPDPLRPLGAFMA